MRRPLALLPIAAALALAACGSNDPAGRTTTAPATSTAAVSAPPGGAAVRRPGYAFALPRAGGPWMRRDPGAAGAQAAAAGAPIDVVWSGRQAPSSTTVDNVLVQRQRVDDKGAPGRFLDETLGLLQTSLAATSDVGELSKTADTTLAGAPARTLTYVRGARRGRVAQRQVYAIRGGVMTVVTITAARADEPPVSAAVRRTWRWTR